MRRWIAWGLVGTVLVLLAVASLVRREPVAASVAPSIAATPAPEASAQPPSIPAATAPQPASGDSFPSARVRKVTPPKVPPGPLVDFVDGLKVAADGGDAEAALLLSHVLQRCERMPTDEAGRAAQLARLKATQAQSRIAPEMVQQQLDFVENEQRFCAGLAPNLAARWHEYLERAAELGSALGSLAYTMALPTDLRVIDFRTASPAQMAQLDAWRQAGVRYAIAAREHGFAAAHLNLGLIYSQESLGMVDYEAAYAHLRVAQLVFQAAGVPFTDDAVLRNARTRLRPLELERAEAAAQRMLDDPRCCAMVVTD